MGHDDLLEQADLYALGVLDGSEAAEFEAHLESGCELCQTRLRETRAVLDSIPKSLAPVAPPAEQKQRLFERIESDKPGLVFIHLDQGDWIEVRTGIFAKVLNRDVARQSFTALVRMAPGSRYEDHRHTQGEEVIVLEGSCYCGGRLLRKGDYHRAEPGSDHFDTRTDEGSLMLLTTAMKNESLTDGP